MFFFLWKYHFWHNFFFLLLISMLFFNLRVGQKKICPQISISETTLYRYFCHITILKWSRIYSRTIRKCLYVIVLLFWSIFHWIPHYNFQKLPPREIIVLEGKQKLFLNQATRRNKMGTCKTWCIDPTHLRITLWSTLGEGTI